MKVKELIEKLQEYDDDLEVTIDSLEHGTLRIEEVLGESHPEGTTGVIITDWELI